MIPTLEDGPKTLCAVGVDAASPDVLAPAMLHHFMLDEGSDAGIGRQFVRVELGSKAHVINDLLFDGLTLDVRNDVRPDFAAPLDEAHNRGLGLGATALRVGSALGKVLVLFLAAYIGFVHFDSSKELAFVLLHGFPYSLVHEPCRFLRDAYLLRHLDGGNALPVLRQQVDSNEPLADGELAFPEDGSGFQGEVLMASSATEPLAIGKAVNLLMAAVGAILTITEADRLKVFLACFLILEVGEEIRYRFESEYRFHAGSLNDRYLLAVCMVTIYRIKLGLSSILKSFFKGSECKPVSMESQPLAILCPTFTNPRRRWVGTSALSVRGWKVTTWGWFQGVKMAGMLNAGLPSSMLPRPC